MACLHLNENQCAPFNPHQKIINGIVGYAHFTWTSGICSTLRYAEGLSVCNTQGGQDEEDDYSHLPARPSVENTQMSNTENGPNISKC